MLVVYVQHGPRVPWDNAQSVPFTRLDVVAQVPSASGVFAVMDGEYCLLIGESWNLKARLLDLANLLDGETQLSILFETCPDEERECRKSAVTAQMEQHAANGRPERVLPGLSLRDGLRRSA
jgi:hypothetical protein